MTTFSEFEKNGKFIETGFDMNTQKFYVIANGKVSKFYSVDDLEDFLDTL